MFVRQAYFSTIELSGDDIRKTFKFNKFSQKERKKALPFYNHLKKLITDKKINLLLSSSGHLKKEWQWNRKNIDNLVEIYIKSNINKIIKLKKKKIYRKHKKNIVGLDIKTHYPKDPHILLNNNFDRKITSLSNEILNKIKEI